jgi:hypothetical protein
MLNRFSKNIDISNFCPEAAKLFHADGQTDGQTGRQKYMKKIIVAFRNIANAPKKPIIYCILPHQNKRGVGI